MLIVHPKSVATDKVDKRMSIVSGQVATLLVLSHEGFKRAVEDAPRADSLIQESMAQPLQIQTGKSPGAVKNMQPVRFMQLQQKAHAQQQRLCMAELDTNFVQFETQPAHVQRCINLACGRLLTAETAERVALLSVVKTMTTVIETVVIAFVCKAGNCEAQYNKALCEFLTIDVGEVSKGKIACDGCKNVVFSTNYGVCSRCKQAQYCGLDCQRAHWQEHRRVCKSP